MDPLLSIVKLKSWLTTTLELQ